MKVTDFLHKYKKALNTRIEDISMALTSGNASDMEAYKAMVGEIQGLTYALDQLRTLLEKTDDDINSA
jgi:predicted  nucleic acid-binding Zn-ribbon protein|tara:strand:+ start:297 stop:500 length:204 start_codon:yes stop_codon:yes gene_type:complete